MTTDDTALRALALVELVHKLGSPEPLADYAALAGEPCEHAAVVLYLAGMVTAIAEDTNYPLQERIENERTALLTPDDTAGAD